MAKSRDSLWMEHAKERMKRKGTLGSFGRATSSKIKSGIRKGGKSKRKAVLARTFKKYAGRRKKRGGRR